VTKWMEPVYTSLEKLLGKKAVMPKERGDLDKSYGEVLKCFETFKATRDKLEDDILALENAFDALMNTVKQNRDVFTKDDFGLNTKDKEDAKKIKIAHDAITKSIGSWMKDSTKSEKEIDELSKHCIEMGKYKSPKATL
jgi:hypothetical protein